MNICRDTVEYKINLTETASPRQLPRKQLCRNSFTKTALQNQFYGTAHKQQRYHNIERSIISIVPFLKYASDDSPYQISRCTEKGQEKGKEDQRRNTAFVGKNIAAQSGDAIQDNLYIDKLQEKS